MTTGKGNQVVKCEKSEARLGSSFCSVNFPNAAAQLWPPWADLEEVGVTGVSRLQECTQLVVRIQQASHVLLKCHYFPSTCKAPVGGAFGHSYMLSALRLHCLGANPGAPRAWSGLKVHKKKGRKRWGQRKGRGTELKQVNPFK